MTNADFVAACEVGAEKTGRPEANGMFYERYDEAGGHFYIGQRGIGNYHVMPDAAAAALWEVHLVDWLRERRVRVYDAGREMGFCIMAAGDQWHQSWAYEWFDNYRSALLAARDAVPQKG